MAQAPYAPAVAAMGSLRCRSVQGSRSTVVVDIDGERHLVAVVMDVVDGQDPALGEFALEGRR